MSLSEYGEALAENEDLKQQLAARDRTIAEMRAEVERLKTPSGYHHEGDPENQSNDYDSILQDSASCASPEDQGKAFWERFECWRWLAPVYVSYRIVDGEAVDIVEHETMNAAIDAAEELNHTNER